MQSGRWRSPSPSLAERGRRRWWARTQPIPCPPGLLLHPNPATQAGPVAPRPPLTSPMLPIPLVLPPQPPAPSLRGPLRPMMDWGAPGGPQALCLRGTYPSRHTEALEPVGWALAQGLRTQSWPPQGPCLPDCPSCGTQLQPLTPRLPWAPQPPPGVRSLRASPAQASGVASPTVPHSPGPRHSLPRGPVPIEWRC